MNKKPIYKSIYFDLPFYINVEDGFRDKNLENWFESYQKGEKNLPYSKYAPRPDRHSGFIIGSNIPIHLPQGKLAKAYEVLVNRKYLVGIQFLVRINQANDNSLIGRVVGDRYGKASFSSVRVNFDLNGFKDIKENDHNFYVNTAIDGVNRFLEFYRLIAQEPHITTISKSAVAPIHTFTTYDDGSNHTGQAVDMSGSLVGLGSERLTKKNDNELREGLKADLKTNIILSIHLDIKNRLLLEEWRLAAIESEILFETWLISFLQKHFKKNGLTDEESETHFYNNDKAKTPKSAHALAKFKVKEATGFDFFKTEEFRNWELKSKNLRNEIVHGKKFDVSKSEAKDSFQSVMKAINLIEEKTF
ncbi:MAG: hypothetical protein RJQ09_15205 [Cyclobacteriaceae bacterium]